MGRLLGRIFHGTNHGDDALFNGVGSIGAEGRVGSAQHDAGTVAVGDAVLRPVGRSVSVPVIASGGCGSLEHFAQVFEEDAADAALAASLFHYGELSIKQVKEYLKQKGVPVRL